MGHAPVDSLPPVAAEVRDRTVVELFSPALRLTTVLCALACFFHMMNFYFLLKWIPKIVADMHFPASAAAGVLVWANVGGATGGALLGEHSKKINHKPQTITVMLLSTVLVFQKKHTKTNQNQQTKKKTQTKKNTKTGIVG